MSSVQKTILSAIIEMELRHKGKSADVKSLVEIDNSWLDALVPVKDFGKNFHKRPIVKVPIKENRIFIELTESCLSVDDVNRLFEKHIREAEDLILKIDYKSLTLKILVAMWYSYMVKTYESYCIMLLDTPHYIPRERPKGLSFVKDVEQVFICRFGLYLSKEWQSFKTFLTEVQELPNYDKWKEEQLTDPKLLTEEYVMQMDNYALTSKYYGANLVSKDTCLFLSLEEIKIYADEDLSSRIVVDIDGEAAMCNLNGYLESPNSSFNFLNTLNAYEVKYEIKPSLENGKDYVWRYHTGFAEIDEHKSIEMIGEVICGVSDEHNTDSSN